MHIELIAFNSVMAPSPPLPNPMPIRDASFAELPPDILISILQRLGVADRIRFGSVCSSFHSAFRAQLYLPNPLSNAPWMLLHDESTTSGATAFFSVTDSKVYRIPCIDSHRRLYLGSSAGWLVTLDREYSQLYLLNRITRTKIHLPPLPSFKLLSLEFSKAVLSSTGKRYTVVLLLFPSSSSSMMCVREGEWAWTPFGKRETYLDAAIRDSYVYAMRLNGTVEAWDLAGLALTKTVITPRRVGFTSFTKYMVDSEDGLLQIWRSREFSKIEFKIFKLDLRREEWVEAKSLDGHIIFLNSCCSVSLDSGDHREFGANSIYFDRLISLKSAEEAESRANSVNLDYFNSSKTRESVAFRMEDESVERVLLHRSIWKNSPIWVVPSLV